MKLSGITKQAGYLEIVFTGPFTADDIEGLKDALVEAARREGGSRLLVNLLQVEGIPSTLDRYKLAMGVVGLPPDLKLSVLGPEKAIDPERFGERVAQNRGVWLRVFTQRSEALDWLLDSKSRSQGD